MTCRLPFDWWEDPFEFENEDDESIYDEEDNLIV